MTIDCIIPARGVSTRLPRKNLAIVEGRPLLAYAVESALTSQVFEHVYVSTEDPEVGEVAVSAGATVLIRPDKLAEPVWAEPALFIRVTEQNIAPVATDCKY